MITRGVALGYLGLPLWGDCIFSNLFFALGYLGLPLWGDCIF